MRHVICSNSPLSASPVANAQCAVVTHTHNASPSPRRRARAVRAFKRRRTWKTGLTRSRWSMRSKIGCHSQKSGSVGEPPELATPVLPGCAATSSSQRIKYWRG
jgi:hypothetical protein